LEDVLLKRLDAIEKLRSIRNAPLGEERRNDFCFVYYVTANGIYDDAEAYRHTQDFNAGFKNPLSDKELKSSLCSARRKDYKYSVKGIMEKLDITPEEASEIGLHAPKPRLSASNKKENRNKEIIRLFNQGFQQKEIAEKFGIACSTVSTVIKRNADKIDTLSDRIRRLLESGKSLSEVSKELKCSIRTVERHRTNPPKSHTSAYRKCDKNSKNAPIYGLSFKEKGGGPIPDSERTAPDPVDKGPLSTQTTAKTNEIFSEIDLYEPFLCGDLSFSQNDALSNVDDTNQARIEAAVMGTLLAAETQDCNLFISSIAMKSQVNGFLQYHADPKRSWIPLTLRQVSDACNNLCQKGLVIADYSATKGDCYFLKHNYSYEKETAELLTALIKSQPKCSLPPTVIFQAIRQYEVVAGFTLSQEQRDAIFLALKKPVAIVTGGPGTGKTAIMAALCHVLKSAAPKARVKLCAPTGKAAVHLSKVTGVTAATMHSLKSKRINCDFLIIDEASMVDIALLHDTLQMVSKGAHILFLGDTDQLPCIGGGNVLRDMIS
jgi:DNA-binding CsgD family transcriptional regulator